MFDVESIGTRLRATKANLKNAANLISQARPQVVICRHANVAFLHKALGQHQSKVSLTDKEIVRYETFLKHVTNPARTPADTAEMDAILTETPYFKHCLLNQRPPFFVKNIKTLAGSVPQRVIFDRSSTFLNVQLHAKIAFITNVGYPIAGSYGKQLFDRASKSFPLYDYCQLLLKKVPLHKIHRADVDLNNLNQLFSASKLPIAHSPEQFTRALSDFTHNNSNIVDICQRKRLDPCPLCAVPYDDTNIHSRVTFACCSAQCCNNCFEALFKMTFNPRDHGYFGGVRCFICRAPYQRQLLLEVTDPLNFPPPGNTQEHLTAQIKPQQTLQVNTALPSLLMLPKTPLPNAKTLVTVST